MKKTILFFGAALSFLGLTAFGLMNWKGSETTHLDASIDEGVVLYSQNVQKIDNSIFKDILFDLSPRFAPMKKVTLRKARAITDFFDANEIKEMTTLKSVDIVVIKNERQTNIREIGYSEQLNEAQLELLRGFDYSSNFSIKASFKKINTETGKLEDASLNPHLTVVPEKQAVYINGTGALMTYLKENSKEALLNVEADKLRPAKLYFTVTIEGTIANIRLDNHSGYKILDETLVSLISKAPGIWLPAENAEGKKVIQELVISIVIKGMGC